MARLLSLAHDSGAEGGEHSAIVRDRVEVLAKNIDKDGSGSLDEQEFMDELLALGFDEELAAEEATSSCGEVRCGYMD